MRIWPRRWLAPPAERWGYCPSHRAAALWAVLMLAHCGVHAQRCSRPIVTPLYLLGVTVAQAADGEVRGAYPELLREFGPPIGCAFAFSIVPRARQELMFDRDEADLLLPLGSTAERDAKGVFVPFIDARVGLVAIRPGKLPADLAELQAQAALRIAVVRGIRYGPRLQAVVEQLRGTGRLTEEASLPGALKALELAHVDAVLMVPTAVYGYLSTLEASDPLLAQKALSKRLRPQVLKDAEWQPVGAYLHRERLDPESLAALRALFASPVWRKRVFQRYQEAYPDEWLRGSLRAEPGS